ncbi:glycosyltransferase family 4 protein [Sphingomonas sp. IC4-52]|uniref:glycosyltransferase family 4 protein n=1 Tax=Sphingomonas sp. IC4-52 TaxID=2887202 RepID=UPI001D1063CE|nr:glycosyltransferase family 1 protein [Sphingomonas sp. IC4-52]MCC2980804.1 glycosyltransferase family 4 protein [Sphingomonas sp. IC4-52]
MMQTARHISINGRFLGRPVSGVERYGRELLRAWDAQLVARPSPLPVRVLMPRGVSPGLTLSAIWFETVGRLGGHAWEQSELYAASRRDVLVGLANSGPLLHSRQLVAVHDAAVFRFPENYSLRYRTLHRGLSRGLARRARLATVSEFSREELVTTLGVSRESVLVAPNGSDHLGQVPPDDTLIERLGLRDTPFLLAVGTASRNKNLGLVIAAWRRLNASATRLVIAGPVNDRVFAQALDLDGVEGVLLPGRVNDAELAALYSHAVAFVFPSRYEGFGIPPLEAIAHGCPVLASAIPPLREVLSEGARFFDTEDADALAGLMREALATPRALPVAARARLARYRWADSAATMHRAALTMAGV